MATTESSTTAPKHRFGMIFAFGVVAAIAVAGWIMYAKSSTGLPQKHEKFAILTWSQTPFWDPVEQGANDAARDFGVDVTFVRSEPDEASQNKHIKELLDSGVQGLAVSPNNPVTQKDTLNQAGSKLVLLTFDSDAPDTNRRGFVGTNNYEAGQVAGEQVRAAIPDGGKVIVYVASIDQTNGRDRRQGLIDNLLERPFANEPSYDAIDAKLIGPEYQVVGTVIDSTGTHSTSGLDDMIKANPDVKCIVGLNGFAGDVAVKAVTNAGKKDQIKIIGFDESIPEQTAVASGAIYASIIQNQYSCGYETVRMLGDYVRGTAQNAPTRAKLVELPVMVMRADNIESLRSEGVIRKPTANQ